MKIKREINGKMIEIELTSRELYQAYCEQEHLFDMESCRDEFSMRYSEEGWYENVSDEDRDFIIEEVAIILRRNLDKYDVTFDYGMDLAFNSEEIKKIIKKYEEASKCAS